MSIELLAPAGDIKALKLAVANGADAVYLGLQNFNARRNAANFTTENISEWVSYAHFFAVKIYVALNINIKENEYEELKSVISACKNAKVDAFIVNDFMTIDLVRELTDIPMHASTQMGICNVYGAEFIEKLGIKRVVLARETTLDDVKQIKTETKLEIEYFAHGALCASYSGQCLFSSIISGESGNRGLCKQPCRQMYTCLNNNKKGYLLSTKDLCTLNCLETLINSGIDSLKLEGRLKRPEYVGVVTKAYRTVLDDIILDKNKKEKINAEGKKNTYKDGYKNRELLSELKRIYNRGEFTTGYLFNDDVMNKESQNHIGEYYGKIIAVQGNYSVLKTKEKYNENNGFKIYENNKEKTGGSYKLIKQKGDNTYLIDYKGKVGDVFNITTDYRQIQTICNNEKKAKIVVKIICQIDRPLEYSAYYSDVCINIQSENIVEKAEKIPVNEETFKKIFNLNQSIFSVDNMCLTIDENAFIPLSVANNLKKMLLNSLQDAVLKRNETILNNSFSYNNYSLNKTFIKQINTKNTNLQSTSVEIPNKKRLVALEINSQTALNIDILAYADFIIVNSDNISSAISAMKKYRRLKTDNNMGFLLYFKLPTVAAGIDIAAIEKFIINNYTLIDGLYTNSLYGITLAEKYRLNVFGGIGLNVFNLKSIDYLPIESITLSAELSGGEITDIVKNAEISVDNEYAGSRLSNKPYISLNKNLFVYAFGNLPLMTFTHCTYKNCLGTDCKSCKPADNLMLRDKKYTFAVRRNVVKNCRFTLYNSVATNILDFCDKYNLNIYLDMVQYTNNANEILKKISTKERLTGNFTKGNLIRGVK